MDYEKKNWSALTEKYSHEAQRVNRIIANCLIHLSIDKASWAMYGTRTVHHRLPGTSLARKDRALDEDTS
jgi:hypothetical protein